MGVAAKVWLAVIALILAFFGYRWWTMEADEDPDLIVEVDCIVLKQDGKVLSTVMLPEWEQVKATRKPSDVLTIERVGCGPEEDDCTFSGRWDVIQSLVADTIQLQMPRSVLRSLTGQ